MFSLSRSYYSVWVWKSDDVISYQIFRLYTRAVFSGNVFAAILPSLASLPSLFFLYSQEQRAQFLFVFFLDGLFSFPSEDRTINLVNREVSSRVSVSNERQFEACLLGCLLSMVVCDVKRYWKGILWMSVIPGSLRILFLKDRWLRVFVRNRV